MGLRRAAGAVVGGDGNEMRQHRADYECLGARAYALAAVEEERQGRVGILCLDAGYRHVLSRSYEIYGIPRVMNCV